MWFSFYQPPHDIINHCLMILMMTMMTTMMMMTLKNIHERSHFRCFKERRQSWRSFTASPDCWCYTLWLAMSSIHGLLVLYTPQSHHQHHHGHQHHLHQLQHHHHHYHDHDHQTQQLFIFHIGDIFRPERGGEGWSISF